MRVDNENTQTTTRETSAKRRDAVKRSRLVEYVDSLAEALRGSLAKAFAGDVDAIHDARVATRRLKAVVELFELHLSKRMKDRFSKTLKRIRRSLGDVRDLDVMIGHMQAWRSADRDVRMFLLDRLSREREVELENAGAGRAPKVLGKLGSWWGLREQIDDDAALGLLRGSLLLQLDEFSLRANLLSGMTMEAPPESAAGHADAMNPHALRIAGKALRYTLEMAAVEGVKIPATVKRAFKHMQDLLGLWHDFVVLTAKVLEAVLDAELQYTQPVLLKKCLVFARASARKADGKMSAFSKLWKAQGAGLQEQIRAALGELEAAEVIPSALKIEI